MVSPSSEVYTILQVTGRTALTATLSTISTSSLLLLLPHVIIHHFLWSTVAAPTTWQQKPSLVILLYFYQLCFSGCPTTLSFYVEQLLAHVTLATCHSAIYFHYMLVCSKNDCMSYWSKHYTDMKMQNNRIISL